MKNILSFLFLAAISWCGCHAEDYVAVAKNGNIYDDANAKYVTVNQDNDELVVIPGMVFETSQHTPGWYKIEYSPGLHAFIPDQIVATSLTPVKAGIYDIKNNPGHQLAVEGNGDNWTASSEGKTYKGKKTENIVVFTDNSNKIIFSLVDLGEGPIVISYDNSVTKFF